MKKMSLMVRALCGVFMAAPLAAIAQMPIAGEDFDGGTTNGGFTASTMVFTPDLSGSGYRGAFDPADPADGIGPIFDRFGEVSRADELPFAVVDDSVSIFTPDDDGFVAETKLDDFVLSVDVTNDFNESGDVSAEWTFDVSGYSDLSLSMDMGMIGNFESSDVYSFTYSIDGGDFLPAFDIVGDDDGFYSYTMDNGVFYDRIPNTFLDEAEWEILVLTGGVGVEEDFTFHPDDDGMTNGDTTAMDGLIPVEFAEGVEDVKAMLDFVTDTETGEIDEFLEVQFTAIEDPLVLTSADGTIVDEIIPADFTNFATALEGSGSTLTLRLEGNSDGSDEYFAFDNILISGVEAVALAGDFNGDGDVDAADYTVWRNAEEAGESVGTYSEWAENYGVSAGAAASVPEPASALLAGLAMLGLGRRRQG